MAGAGTSADPEAFSDHETLKELDAPSSSVVAAEGVPVSVRSSSDYKAVTTPNATSLVLVLAARATRDGVEVPVDTYSG